MSGILYGTGIDPGDPELLTLKAVRLIRENEVIALPGPDAKETAAYQIAVQAVPELADKRLLALDMPMTHDLAWRERCHDEAADKVEACLREGENVIFLTLGDPAVYSTYLYTITPHILGLIS
ncbi:MAG: SAM-dependent methyltransferase [Lachnospiraceae bacterium]|nr:SAM-dependent methyltransferase [Lachnospiraceae bacterium]